MSNMKFAIDIFGEIKYVHTHVYSSVPNSRIGANRSIGLAIFKISYKHRVDLFQIEA